MQQNNRLSPQRPKRRLSFLPWLILGLAALVVIGVLVISRLNEDKSPPQPVGGNPPVSRVNLIIQSNVGGAEVYLDGVQKATISDTENQATLFNLAPKTYQITLKKQGYADQTESVEVTGTALSQTVQINMQPTQ